MVQTGEDRRPETRFKLTQFFGRPIRQCQYFCIQFPNAFFHKLDSFFQCPRTVRSKTSDITIMASRYNVEIFLIQTV